MDHHNSNPFCSKVNYTQFPTFRAVNSKGVKSVYKKVCQSSLTMPSSSPPNVFKTLNYLKEKEEDGWININPICETTQPFKNESQTAMNQLRENVILLIQVLSIHTSEMTWSFETIPHWAWQTVLCCWIPVKCQLQAKDGITSWRDRKKKKKLIIYHWRYALGHIQKAKSNAVKQSWGFHPISEQSLSFSGY